MYGAQVRLYSYANTASTAYYGTLKCVSLGANRTYTLPNNDGTVLLDSTVVVDITDKFTLNNSALNMNTTSYLRVAKLIGGHLVIVISEVTGTFAANTHTNIFTIASGYGPSKICYSAGICGIYGTCQIAVNPGYIEMWKETGFTGSLRINAVYVI
jgi:hypothetical protein